MAVQDEHFAVQSQSGTVSLDEQALRINRRGRRSSVLYLALLQLVSGSALPIFAQFDAMSNGFEAWRQLL